MHVQIGEQTTYVGTRFRFYLAFEYILVLFEVGLAGRIYFPHFLFTTQYLKSHVCGSDIACYHQKVARLRPATVHFPSRFGVTYYRYRQHQSGSRRSSVAAYDIHSVNIACQAHTVVKLLHSLHRKTVRYGYRYEYLLRYTVHGTYIRYVFHHGFVTYVF